MKQVLPIVGALLLSGCITNPFSSTPDVDDNAMGHAEKVCHVAGENSDTEAPDQSTTTTSTTQLSPELQRYVPETDSTRPP